ncbi:hypothetical protein GGX14DRAFT_572563 [Mycena pura]|uniref:Uncharacterized protein n=1 Tax=Mycena pura TaxID=153505 RepID=A0AAD6Y3S3_9AGAR|nr:hypothetical protein GGX14DRAFT_572563 [Mycena pura]
MPALQARGTDAIRRVGWGMKGVDPERYYKRYYREIPQPTPAVLNGARYTANGTSAVSQVERPATVKTMIATISTWNMLDRRATPEDQTRHVAAAGDKSLSLCAASSSGTAGSCLLCLEDRAALPYVDALCKDVLRWHVAAAATAISHRAHGLCLHPRGPRAVQSTVVPTSGVPPSPLALRCRCDAAPTPPLTTYDFVRPASYPPRACVSATGGGCAKDASSPT